MRDAAARREPRKTDFIPRQDHWTAISSAPVIRATLESVTIPS